MLVAGNDQAKAVVRIVAVDRDGRCISLSCARITG